MGRQKSLLKSISITVAERQHSCRHDKNRVINKGEARLEIKEGRKISRYCLETAEIFLKAGIEKLQTIAQDVKERRSLATISQSVHKRSSTEGKEES